MTGHSNWHDQAPTIQAVQSTSKAHTDVDSQLSGFTDADVAADPPANAGLDDNNSMSHNIVNNICIFH